VLAARATGARPVLSGLGSLRTSECSGTETEPAELQCSGMERRQTAESGPAAGGSVPSQIERRAKPVKSLSEKMVRLADADRT
jgi:hypothetical protein